MKWRTQAACWTRPPSFRRTRAQFWLLSIFSCRVGSPQDKNLPIASHRRFLHEHTLSPYWCFSPRGCRCFPQIFRDILASWSQFFTSRRSGSEGLEEDDSKRSPEVGAGVESTESDPTASGSASHFLIRFVVYGFVSIEHQLSYQLPSGELTFCHGTIHHAINGKIHYFDWAIFHSKMLVHQRVVIFICWPQFFLDTQRYRRWIEANARKDGCFKWLMVILLGLLQGKHIDITNKKGIQNTHWG